MLCFSGWQPDGSWEQWESTGLFASGLINGQALYGFVTDGWIGAIEGQKAAVYRIAAVRVAQTVAAAGICRSRMQNFGIPFLLVLTGFAGSTALVVFTWCRGLEGMWCFLVSGFPHQLFYLQPGDCWLIDTGMVFPHAEEGSGVR